MQLIYTTHQTLHPIVSWLSWVLVIGAAYGFLRLVLDAVKAWADFMVRITGRRK